MENGAANDPATETIIVSEIADSGALLGTSKLVGMIRSIKMSLAVKSILILCALSLLLSGFRQTVAQSSTSDPFDQFHQYRVGGTFKGKPAPPVLSSPDAHEFRTKIREGVAKGIVFAGHYEVAVWGCGSGCLSFAVIDAFTGKVTFFPASVSQNREAGERLTYRRNSKAIHIIGSLNEEDSADRWYFWDGVQSDLEAPGDLSGRQWQPLNPKRTKMGCHPTEGRTDLAASAQLVKTPIQGR